jgi:hypothetical protein
MGSSHAIVAQSNSCDISWLTTAQLSYDSVPSNVPQLAISGDAIHALWYGLDTLGTISNDGIQYAGSSDGGETFSPPIKLASADTALDAGAIACSGNFVYVTFLAFIDTFYGAALLRSSDAGLTWQSFQFLASYSIPRLIVAKGTNVYIQYFDQIGNRFGLLRSSNYGSTWFVADSSMQQLSQMVSAGGLLHGVSEVDFGVRKEIGYYYSINSGARWFGPEILSLEDVTSSTLPSIAVNENGELFAAWNDTGTIVMRRSFIDPDEGLLWKPQIAVSQAKGAVFSSIAASGDFVSVVWDNELGSSSGIKLRPSNNLAATFCPIASPTSNGRSGAPTIQIIGNRIDLLWSEQVGSNGEIIFRTGILQEGLTPETFILQQNYPNPFNGITTITYDLPAAANVTLTVYNIIGQRVATLVNDFQLPQQYTIPFPADNLPSGVYFYRLTTNTFSTTKKMILMK